MKLLLSDEEIRVADLGAPHCQINGAEGAVVIHMVAARATAQAQLDKIFNLDIKTTAKLIDKLRKRLDKLYEEV